MKRLAVCALLIAAHATHAQQVPDRGYAPAIARPLYSPDKGPIVCVDEAHANFHTLGERFFAFGELLRRDGYRVMPGTRMFAADALGACAVLVISNARAAPESGSPSAFTDAEISAVHAWVEQGGALLLIADHMPFGRAAQGLAAAFDVEFTNGFALRDPQSDAPDLFRLEDHTLRAHAVTRGRNKHEAVTRVRTFAGQAFRAPRAQALLLFPRGYSSLAPDKPWVFTEQTPRIPVAGWLQGAVQFDGKGRAAFFGEAAMFSAQFSGPEREPAGMNAPGAEQNFQLVLNLLHWLTGKL